MEKYTCYFCNKDHHKYQKITYEDNTFSYACKKCCFIKYNWDYPKQIKDKEFYICDVKLDIPSKESPGYKEFIDDDEIELEKNIYCNHLQYMKKRYFKEGNDESEYQHENDEKHEATTIFKNIDGKIYAFCDDCLGGISSSDFYDYLQEFGHI